MTYTSELTALFTAFFQRNVRFPNAAEEAELRAAAYEQVYGSPKSCGHQLTESEVTFYQRHPERDKLCQRCAMEERAS